MADDEEEAELHRLDTWMQSMVPSLPRPFAIACLVCNIIIPGLGTFSGGVISCCAGRPRVDFRPARHRCPTAMLVMFIGVAQLVSTTFFLVGWLWSIIWGFLMVNLSDPKFRVLPPKPQPKPQPGSRTPSVKLEIPPEDAPRGRKNFNRVIMKAASNKDQALGLKPPPSSKWSSILSALRCVRKGAPPPPAPVNKTDSRSSLPKKNAGRSESKQNLVEDGGNRSRPAKGAGTWTTVLSVRRLIQRWRKLDSRKAQRARMNSVRVGASNVVPTTLPCVPDAAASTAAPPARRGSCYPDSQQSSSSTSGSKRGMDSDFSKIVSVTPATPVHSVPTKPVNQNGGVTGPHQASAKPKESRDARLPGNAGATSSGTLAAKKDPIKASSKPDPTKRETGRSDGARTETTTKAAKEPQAADGFKPEAKCSPGQAVKEAGPQKPDVKAVDPTTRLAPEVQQDPAKPPVTKTPRSLDKEGEKTGDNLRMGDAKAVLLVQDAAGVTDQQTKPESGKTESTKTSGSSMEANTMEKGGTVSARELYLNPGELQRPMKPRLMQSVTYHFDA